jgi:hypothetical protein
MSRTTLTAVLLGLVLLGSARAAEIEGLDFVASASLPPAVVAAIKASPALKGLTVETRINPFYLQGDFDGDGKTDTALLVRQKASGKSGIAIVHGGARAVAVLGAGKDFGNGGDDFSWQDAWYAERRPGTGHEDDVVILKTESGGGRIAWDGKRYVWHQQGD